MKTNFRFAILLFACLSLSSVTFSKKTLSINEKLPIPTENEEIPSNKARKKIVDEIEKKTIGSMKETSFKSEQVTQQQYTDFFNQLEITHKSELQNIENSSISTLQKLAQKSIVQKNYSVAYSGNCMAQKEGVFDLTNDTDGQEIAVFLQESIRNDPRYGLIDDFQQGFARIQKNEVYGFLDFCGNEAIQPQYDYAERFNEGKALVKRFYWHFVNLKGEESEPLIDIIDAKALKFGISIAKFTDKKMALINNEFDTNNSTISEKFDEISILTSDILLVRIGKKFGIISLDGKAETTVDFDKILLEGKHTLLLQKGNNIQKRTI